MDEDLRALERAAETGDTIAASKLMTARLRSGYYLAAMRQLIAELGEANPKAPDIRHIRFALMFFESWTPLKGDKTLHDVVCDLDELPHNGAMCATREQREKFVELMAEYNEAALGIHLM